MEESTGCFWEASGCVCVCVCVHACKFLVEVMFFPAKSQHCNKRCCSLVDSFPLLSLAAFGFCEYADPESTLRALRLLHDFKLSDKNLVVRII